MGAKKPVSKSLQKVKLVEQPNHTLTLFAICTTENGYRLSWLLNSALSLNLQRQELNFEELPPVISKLDIFAEAQNNGAILLPNKLEPSKFITSKHKQFDYLLVLHQQLTDKDITLIESTLKKIPGIVATIQITELEKKIVEFVNLF
ncbi:IPExxxVDY family protein [Acetobacteroides hydrogenigenes]|uniref:IPExxxVDY family protein n=1 Tax=Acetobacteroides hydrogenigenes TaxID=979970 RepID=A0A4R2E5Z8_9BACT|nr:IPExxxVDY family protein [Acetobacteroides hydrogenigenes]TCN63858.1 hypothetical protein CLV25_11413 [Acetobacteroides hydrogenigenes]